MKRLGVLLALVFFVLIGLITGKINLPNILPFLLVLICPAMMLFMMGGHKHK